MADRDANLQEAERAFAQGRLADAFALCKAGLDANPKDARSYFLGALISAKSGDARRAGEFAAHAAALDPANAQYMAYLAKCYSALQRHREADAVAERAEKLGPQDAQTWDMLGYVFSRAGDHTRALAAFERALALDPNMPAYWLNLAATHVIRGDIEAGRAAYEKCVALEPDFSPAYVSLVNLGRQTPERNYVARLETLLARAQGAEQTLQIGHALAKSYEDLGQYAAALSAYARAKAPAKVALKYSTEQERNVFDAAALAQQGAGAGHASIAPIFVVGLPRTGTTLIDRVLSSHPDVASAGELMTFPSLVHNLAAPQSPALYSPAIFERARSLDPAALGRAYEQKARERVGAAQRFVDKLPFNFLYAGLIHRALPNARIVCLRRDPMDSVLSNYRQLFGIDQPLYHYSFDLEDTAHYFVMFDRLVAHWRKVLPANRFTEISYENLVANQERETRRLLAFCDLAWDPRCLSFHENDAPVSTASSAQVREPLNTRSIGRWRKYGALLDPARQILNAAGLAASD